MSRSRPIRVIASSLLVGLTLLVAACGTTDETAEPATTTAAPKGFAGYVRTPAVDVSSVALSTVEGKAVDMVAPTDGLLIVYFGYASCPDICPMTLTALKGAVADQRPADRSRVQVAMITVDPARDSTDTFGDYLAQFFPTGWALRTEDPNELRSAADAFGADYRIRMNQDGKREVTHSDELYVVDETGRIVLAWPFGLSPETLSADLRQLLAGKRPTAEN